MTRLARRLALPLLLAACARADAPPPPRASVATPVSAALTGTAVDARTDTADALAAAFADTTAPWPPDDSVREKAGGLEGVITVVRDSARPAFRVYLNGGEVLADSGEVRLAALSGRYERMVALLEIAGGDPACGATYRVLDITDGRPPLLTPAFGCGTPRVAMDGTTWRIGFAAAGGHAAETYEYRDTTLARLASARAPRRVLSAARGEGDAWRTPWSERRSLLPGRLVTPDGVLEITRAPMQGDQPSPSISVLVDGRAVLQEEFASSMEVYALVPATPAHGTLAILRREDGGNGCEGLFRVVEMRLRRPPRVTAEFGSCVAYPDLFTSDGGLRMEFAPWWTRWQEAEPGFRRPRGQAFAYRAGRMVRVPLSPAAAARWAR
jgi:hypothetical protein